MKKAVVLIHGIGEQRPMATLRSFVDAILPDTAEGKEKYWSKPDPMSDLFELRRLQTSGQRKTHFYEYYWAYHVEGTRITHLGRWFFALLFRRPSNVPSTIRGIWMVSWMLTLLFVILLLTGGLRYFGIWFTPQAYLTPLWFIGLLIFTAVQGVLIYYLGDAARYLSPHPRNVAVRQKIRSDGVKLLKHLLESGEYDRILVVGHSLGSVIGYDIITRLWIDYNTKYSFSEHGAEIVQVLEKGDNPQDAIRTVLRETGYQVKTNRNEKTIDDFRRAQHIAFREQRKWGNPWCISDFITLGSPLAHAMLLMADDRVDLEARKRQRELPTCPPKTDVMGYAYGRTQGIDVGDGKRFTPLILHHGAPFAVTRWTNIYFPAILGLFGDIIGGPLHSVFGTGIKDIPVSHGGWIRYTLFSHTRYWKMEQGARNAVQKQSALDLLRQTLGLDREGFQQSGASKANPDSPDEGTQPS